MTVEILFKIAIITFYIAMDVIVVILTIRCFKHGFKFLGWTVLLATILTLCLSILATTEFLKV